MTQPVPDLDELARRDGRYGADAFGFVSQSLRHAAKRFGKDRANGSERHLSAHQLVDATLDLAAERYGMLAGMVLRTWGIRTSEDVGAITFAFIDHGVFTKQPSDRIEDFYAGPQFAADIDRRVCERMLRRRAESAN